MFHPSFPRVPLAGIDPIRSSADALAVITMAMADPLVDETIVLSLDHARRGLTVISVDGTRAPDSVLDVVAACATAAQFADHVAGLVVASVRPSCPIIPGDVERWLEASDCCDDAGVELVEWFVVTADSIEAPRDLFGEPPRWER